MSEIRENREELINGLKHMLDDHPCCKGTIELAIQELSLLPDVSMIEHVGKCECYDPESPKPWTEIIRRGTKCPKCQGTGETTRPATFQDIVEKVMSMFNDGYYTEINIKYGDDSGGILRIKEGKE